MIHRASVMIDEVNDKCRSEDVVSHVVYQRPQSSGCQVPSEGVSDLRVVSFPPFRLSEQRQLLSLNVMFHIYPESGLFF